MLHAGIDASSPFWPRLLSMPREAAMSVALALQLVDLIVAQPATRSWLWTPLLQLPLAAPADAALADLCVHIRQCVARLQLTQQSAPSAAEQRLIDELTGRVANNVDSLSLQRAMELLDVAPHGQVGERVAEYVLSELSDTSDLALMRKTAEAMLRCGVGPSSPLWRSLMRLPAQATQTIALIRHVLASVAAAREKLEIVAVCIERCREMPAEHRTDALDVLRAYFLMAETEATFTGAAALASLGDLIAIAVGKVDAVPPHAAYKRLGAFHAAVMCLNASHFKIQWPDEYKPVWKQVISNAASLGRLNLNAIPQIAKVRNDLRVAAPNINWNPVFDAKSNPIPERRFLGGSLRIRQTLSALLAGLDQLIQALESYNNVLHKQGKPRNEDPRKTLLKLKDEHIVKLINDLLKPGSVNLKHATTALRKLAGMPNKTMVSGLFDGSTGDKPTVRKKPTVRTTVSDVVKSLDGELAYLEEVEPSLCTAAKAWHDAWAGVTTLAADAGFEDELALCDEYEVQLLDLDSVNNLVLGHEVSCCISPTGGHSNALLERLSGSWFLWAVRNMAGSVTTVAWATLNQHQHLVIDFIDQRVNFRTPESSSNDMVGELLAYATNVATATNVAQVWLAEPAYARIAGVHEYTSRTFGEQDFVPFAPTFLGTKTFVDKLKGKNGFVRLV